MSEQSNEKQEWRWTPPRAAVALLLAQGKTYREIQQELRVSASTIAEWKKEPEFMARIDAIIEESVSEARRILRRNAAAAAAQLVNLHAYGNAMHTVKLAASKDILDRVGLKAPEKHEHTITPGTAAQLTDDELDAELKKRGAL